MFLMFFLNLLNKRIISDMYNPHPAAAPTVIPAILPLLVICSPLYDASIDPYLFVCPFPLDDELESSWVESTKPVSGILESINEANVLSIPLGLLYNAEF